MKQPPPPARVLVVQTSLLGDLVLSTPVFAAVRRCWPEARVSVLARPEVAAILDGHPHVDEIIVQDKHGLHAGLFGVLRQSRELRRRGFDLVLCLSRSTRAALTLALAEIPLRVGFRQNELSLLFHRRVWRDPSKHDIDRQLSILDGIGVRYEGGVAPLLGVTPAARAGLDDLLAGGGVSPTTPYVAIAPGSSWLSKQWPAERYAGVARVLLERGEIAVFVGNAGEAPMIAEIRRLAGGGIDLAGRTDCAGLAAAIARASAVLCNDSAAMHVAEAFAVPLVAVVGPTSEAQGFMPRGRRSIVVHDASLDCRPKCRFGGDACPMGTRACMHNVTVEQVLAALDSVRESLSERPPAVASGDA